MQEYFNYFTEIEDRFQQRRGTLLMLSTLDWALIEGWKDAGIPLEAVLRGIDAAFDKYDRRSTKTRKVNSLAYCTQEVMAAAEEIAEAAVGTTREKKDDSVASQEVAAYLEKNAAAFEKAQVPAASKTLIAEDVKSLREVAAIVREQPSASMEDLERRMTVMEEKLFASLLTVTADDDIITIRAQADRELAPYRSKMTGAQIEQLMKQYVNKKLLERHNLPRLSLFYM